MEFKRLEGENDNQLIFRICQCKDQIGTWDQVADVLNKLLGQNFCESTYRKKFSAYQSVREVDDDDSAQTMRDLEIQRIKYRDERNAWQKQNRDEARLEQRLDYLEEELKQLGRVTFPVVDPKHDYSSTGHDIVIMLSDMHIGAEFDNYFGKYNTEIATERLAKLLNRVKNMNDIGHYENCYVVGIGDYISGSIHKSIQVTNRENVIDQIKIAAELVSNFCYELTKVFSHVYFTSVSGNHSRIDKKDEALKDERLDDLVSWGVDMTLNHIGNFHDIGTHIDTSLVGINIRNGFYFAVHGDYDAFTKSSVQNLISATGVFPKAVMFGHLHQCALDNCQGIWMIRGGSLCGSGDDFTVSKRLTGKASQMVFTVNDDGIEGLYPVMLE